MTFTLGNDLQSVQVNRHAKNLLIQTLLSGYVDRRTDTHTHTAPIALAGLCKGFVVSSVYTIPRAL